MPQKEDLTLLSAGSRPEKVVGRPAGTVSPQDQQKPSSHSFLFLVGTGKESACCGADEELCLLGFEHIQISKPRACLIVYS